MICLWYNRKQLKIVRNRPSFEKHMYVKYRKAASHQQVLKLPKMYIFYICCCESLFQRSVHDKSRHVVVYRDLKQTLVTNCTHIYCFIFVQISIKPLFERTKARVFKKINCCWGKQTKVQFIAKTLKTTIQFWHAKMLWYDRRDKERAREREKETTTAILSFIFLFSSWGKAWLNDWVHVSFITEGRLFRFTFVYIL